MTDSYELRTYQDRIFSKPVGLNGNTTGTLDMVGDHSDGGAKDGNFYWLAAKDGETLEIKRMMYRISIGAGAQADSDGFGSGAALGTDVGTLIKIKRKGTNVSVWDQTGVTPSTDQLLQDVTGDFGVTFRRNIDALKWGGTLCNVMASEWGGTIGDQVIGTLDFMNTFGRPITLKGSLGDYIVVQPQANIQNVVGFSITLLGVVKNHYGWWNAAT